MDRIYLLRKTFREKKKSVKVASIAYDAWGESSVVRKQAEVIIKKAIYDGSNPNECDLKSFAAMHWAAQYNWPSLVTLLVNAERFPPANNGGIKTDVNIRQGSGGRTALHMAVHRGNKEVVTVLFEEGADITLRYEGMTAADIAIDNEDLEMYQLMCNYYPELAIDSGDLDSSFGNEDKDVDFETAINQLKAISGILSDTDDDDSGESDEGESDDYVSKLKSPKRKMTRLQKKINTATKTASRY